MRAAITVALILGTLLLGCVLFRAPYGSMDERPSMVPLENTPRLDSLVLGFRGDSLCHAYQVTDPRVLHAPCAGVDTINPVFYAMYSFDMYTLEVTEPCTVSVVLTDSIGGMLTWRHFFVDKPGILTKPIFSRSYGFDYPGPSRLNLLIGGVLVLSCLLPW